MCRRQTVPFETDYGLETFKNVASQHWVEGVVIARQKGNRKQSSHVVVAVNQSLIEAAASCDDIQSVLRAYADNVDYKGLSFRQGENNNLLLKVDADVYWSGFDGEKILSAINQDKGVLTLLRKDVEDWTDADLQSFYHHFMVPNFGYHEVSLWKTFDNVGYEAANVLRHARHLCGISGLTSGWNETPERFHKRLRDWDTNQRVDCLMMEKYLLEGFLHDMEAKELRQLFEKYCTKRDAHKGISIENVLRRRGEMASHVKYQLCWSDLNSEKGKALGQFYEDIAANPDEDARSRFVFYQKTWD